MYATNDNEAQQSTFTDLYSTASSDPFDGNYTSILNEYAVNATGTNASSDQLLKQIVDSPQLRQCFVMIKDDKDDKKHPRKVVNLHNLSKRAACMGQAASNLDGRFYAFQGDLFTGGIGIQTVEVPSLLLEPLKDAVRVPKIANINGAIEQMQANARGIAPLADVAVDADLVRTRMAAMVPHAYVALVLQKNRTPVEFWTDIIGQILQDGKQEECKILIDWGRVALMNDENGDCIVSLKLHVPFMDPELAKYHQTILTGILPTIGRMQQVPGKPVPFNLTKTRKRKIAVIERDEGACWTLPLDGQMILNPKPRKETKYYCRKGLKKEIYDKLISDQVDEEYHNISLIGAPGSGKSCLVSSAAEEIAMKGKNVLWAARRVPTDKWSVRVFIKDTVYSRDPYMASLEEILESTSSYDIKVLIIDAPAVVGTDSEIDGITAFKAWSMAGDETTRTDGRRVIHVSSLGAFGTKQTIRDLVKMRILHMPIFTRDDYIESLQNDNDLLAQVCETICVDPKKTTALEVVKTKLYYAGINARWFYNSKISEIEAECKDIIALLGWEDVASCGVRNPNAVNSAYTTTFINGRQLTFYTSLRMLELIGSSSREAKDAKKFLRLYPLVAKRLGNGTPGEIFEFDFEVQMIDCHDRRISRQVFFGKDDDNCRSIMVSLGHCTKINSDIEFPAGKIHNLPLPPTEDIASQDIGLTSDDMNEIIPKWFIPKSKNQPFLDFMVLVPQVDNKWKLVIIQNTIAKAHAANSTELVKILNGLLSCGFQIDLSSDIDIVYVIEDDDKSGSIAIDLNDCSIEPTICNASRNQGTKQKQFKMKVYHSTYKRTSS